MKDVSLMHGYEIMRMERIKATGMKGSFLWCVPSCLRITQNVFFPFVSLRDR